MTLLEVLVALVLLTLVLIYVAENMIATSWGENKASQRSTTVTAANYLLGIVHGDPNLWGKGKYPDTPTDGCGKPMTPVDDPTPIQSTNWHTIASCANDPPELSSVQYQWQESQPVQDQANITVWVRSVNGSHVDEYEVHSFTHQVPTQLTLATPPPSPSPTPTPTPTPSHSPSPTPTPTVKPSPTATPSPTPTPTATPIGV